MKGSSYLLGAFIILSIVYGVRYFLTSPKENYKDNLWLNKSKFDNNYYPHTNGSIYGGDLQVYNMFSGLNSNIRAY